jgi:hypothetical protein
VFLNSTLEITPSEDAAQNPYTALWGTDGWTIFTVFCPKAGVTSGSAEEQLLRFTGSHLALRVTLGGAGYANGAVRFGNPSVTDYPGLFAVTDVGQARVLAVRINFLTNDIQAWLDGAPWITKATYSPAFNKTGTLTQATLGTSAASNTPLTTSTLRSMFGGGGVPRMVTAATVHYRRPLTQSEMRAAFDALASMYSTTRSQSAIEVL